MTDLWRLDALALSRGYAARDFTPAEALDSCLARARACEPRLNALVHLDAEGARRAAMDSGQRWARGEPLSRLDGVPLTVKDNLHVAGMPTRWGTRILPGRAPDADERPVARLRAAGLVILGKTNVPEFAMVGFTANAVSGVTRNPWDPRLTPGGSSGGAVAATASGYAPLALGTDGGGSIRRPASHTGLLGLKPSAGVVARGGGLPEIFLSHEVVGPIARRAADLEAVMDLLGPPPAAPEPRRILLVPRFGDHPVEDAILDRTRDAARMLGDLGLIVEEAQGFDLAEEINALWPGLSAAGLAWMLERPGDWPEFGGASPDLSLLGAPAQAALRDGRAAGATALFAVLRAVVVLERRLAEVFARHDAILTPAAAALPWPAEDTHPTRITGRPVGPRGHAVFTAFANAAGLPGLALPCGLVGGLPVGVQLVGRRGSDAGLLALARRYEAARPDVFAWPPDPAAPPG